MRTIRCVDHVVRTLALVLATALVAAAAPVTAAAPSLLSPGSPDQVTLEGGPCPTFSWTLEPGATAYELVVYRLEASPSGGPPEDAPPVLDERLPAGATGWSPPLGRCLERGRRYAWFVRAESGGVPSSWSEGSLFEVADLGATEGSGPATGPPGRPTGSADTAGARAVEAGIRHGSGSPAVGNVSGKAGTPVAFHAGGGVRIVGEYAFDRPRPVRRFYPASRFLLQKRVLEDDLWHLSGDDYGGFVGGVGPLDVDLVLPLDDLPSGAELKQLTCRFLDDSAADLSATFVFRRRSRFTTETRILANLSIDTTGSSEALEEVRRTPFERFVSDEFMYWIDGTYTADTESSRLRFYGCELAYEIAHVGPVALRE